MKSRKIVIAIAVIAAMAAVALALAACEADYIEEIRPQFGLLSFSVQPVILVNGLPVDNPAASELEIEAIPEPVIEEDWDDPYVNLAEADSQEMWFLLDAHTQIARLKCRATPGYKVSWGLGTTGSKPAEFLQPGAALEFGNDDVIYVRVSTIDEKYRSYYRIHARRASIVNALSVLSVAGRETKIRPAEDGREDWDEARKAAVAINSISITLKEGHNGSDILATKLNDNATVKYAVVPNGTDLPTTDLSALHFTYWESKEINIPDPVTGDDVLYKGSNIAFEDQDFLIAEVTAQNTFDKNYYKFRVSVGRIVNINKVVMKEDKPTGGEVSQVLALGVPNEDPDKVVSGSFATAVVTPAFKADITLEDEDASFEFFRIDTAGVEQGAHGTPTPTADPATKTTASITYGNKEELGLLVSSATEVSPGVPAAQTYYRVKFNLLSAIIEVQPKSNVYYIMSHTYQTSPVQIEVDGQTKTEQRILITAGGADKRTLDKPIEPLKAELDRVDPNFTYQWYTANSWYGGYGFDQEGRIVGDPDCEVGVHPYHPMTERGGLDEKNNVSFHNGGNQFYRLPVAHYRDNEDGTPGWTGDRSYETYAIPGATSAEYTPVIDAHQRPFISGYSNQTQYYWVIVKDAGGREVISERAAIVTEWGEVFDHGSPTGEKVSKKHYIVDLYAYRNPLYGRPYADGLQDNPMNEVPFKAGKHGDKYLIPITFPPSFYVMDYRVATVQARFFLADGTVWIQNWTQGDVGFEKDGQGQVLYYNLTNNNATVGLAGDSKEPQGADLLETPTHVVVKPAGEKPITDLPPFESDGRTPKNNNDAQGWFTPYIEIVELRFEGPAR
jgi:hypothetical protein